MTGTLLVVLVFLGVVVAWTSAAVGDAATVTVGKLDELVEDVFDAEDELDEDGAGSSSGSGSKPVI